MNQKTAEQIFAEEQQAKHATQYEVGQAAQKVHAETRDAEQKKHPGKASSVNLNAPMHDPRMSNISQAEITKQHQAHQQEVREAGPQRQGGNPAADRLAAKQQQMGDAGKAREARPQDLDRVEKSQGKLAEAREKSQDKARTSEHTADQSKKHELTQ